ncbi:MAG TPA: ATP-binding protein [Candidatus Eisenbacteria bacterium]|nr:ATP-binding protein [Candidatus Eisenbacteria bacterium]
MTIVTTAKQMPEVIAIRIPSRLELLSVLDRVCESVCQRMSFDDDTTAQISMSVIEAGTNAIQHGHKRDATKPVDVEFRLLPDQLEVVVNDQGAGFDVGAVNGDVTSPEHLFDARGRGIFIMRSCMDQVDFSFSGHGTQVRLVKKRSPQAENR